MHIRVTCIRRAIGEFQNPYMSITHLGWTDEEPDEDVSVITRHRMHEFVMDGGKAYVFDEKGEKIFLQADYTRDGLKFVRSSNTEDFLDDLLFRLPACGVNAK